MFEHKEERMAAIPEPIKKQISQLQKGEITEYYVYKNIAKRTRNLDNRRILEKIASEEKAHYLIWTQLLGQETTPRRFHIFFLNFLSLLFGYTFAIKLMEKGEDKAKASYEEIGKHVPEAIQIAHEEDIHEQQLIGLLNEERLNYIGSMVLGLNDALVELSGTLAGLTFAFADPKLISLSGLITGIAASLSMAASEYLSAHAENKPDALKSALYTGGAYIVTVALLILPYLLIPNHFVALGVMLLVVVFIIFIFNYYLSVAKDLPFRKRFFQMVVISLGVAAISFGIGILIKLGLGIEV